MIEFRSLASSSKGNAYLVSDTVTRILLECGLPYRELRRRLGSELSRIDSCLITHEHKDHAKAAQKLLDNCIQVCASQGTIQALDLHGYGLKQLEAKHTVQVGSFNVLPFAVEHDAAEPLGFLLCSGNDRLLFATDCGNIRYRFPGLTEIAVECNHDETMMEHSNEPWVNRARQTHMDIGQLIVYLSKTDLSRVRHIYLLHMSSRYGDAATFQYRIESEFEIPTTVCDA